MVAMAEAPQSIHRQTKGSELPGKAAEYAHALREHLPELRERHGVSSLGIFGSYVRCEQDEDSDLDVLVEFDRPIGLFGLIATERYISELLDVNVDLVMKQSLERRIGRAILEEVVPL